MSKKSTLIIAPLRSATNNNLLNSQTIYLKIIQNEVDLSSITETLRVHYYHKQCLYFLIYISHILNSALVESGHFFHVRKSSIQLKCTEIVRQNEETHNSYPVAAILFAQT